MQRCENGARQTNALMFAARLLWLRRGGPVRHAADKLRIVDVAVQDQQVRPD